MQLHISNMRFKPNQISDLHSLMVILRHAILIYRCHMATEDFVVFGSVNSHFLNQWWLIFKWTLRNIFQYNRNHCRFFVAGKYVKMSSAICQPFFQATIYLLSMIHYDIYIHIHIHCPFAQSSTPVLVTWCIFYFYACYHSSFVSTLHSFL